jgi:hypothetical protein
VYLGWGIRERQCNTSASTYARRRGEDIYRQLKGDEYRTCYLHSYFI